MALSRLAKEFAAEIRNHDWSDAPYRADKAGHRREHDGAHRSQKTVEPEEADLIRLNVAWVVGQVLLYRDPNFDIYEFADACGIPSRFLYRKDGSRNGMIRYGLRVDADGQVHRPGTNEPDPSDG